MNTFKITLANIFILLFSIAIFFFHSNNIKRFYYGIDTNEIIQDWLDETIQLEDTVREVLAHKTELIKHENNIFVEAFDGRLVFKHPPIGYEGVIRKSIGIERFAIDSLNRPFAFSWNPDIFCADTLARNKLFWWNAYIYVVLILPVSFFLFIIITHLLLNILRKKSKSHENVFIRSLIVSICGGLFVLYLLFSLPHWRNYNNTHRELEVLLKNNLAALDSALTTSEYTGLHPLSFLSKDPDQPELEELRWRPYFPLAKQEKNIHNGKVFISKTPFMPYDYIRINVDFFTYLFYAPTLQAADLSAINQVMSFTALGDGLWLGEYRMFKNAIHRLVWSYFFALILWSLMLVFSVIALIRSGRGNRKERIANKSDHLSLGGP